MVCLLDKNRDKSFVNIMVTLLQSKGLKIQSLDEASYSVGTVAKLINQSSLGDKKKVSWPSETCLDILKKQLEELGLWMLDDDFSCKVVVYHRL